MLEIQIIEPYLIDGLPVMHCSTGKISHRSAYIAVWPPKTRAELYTILHEQGHIQDKILDTWENRRTTVEEEIDAWLYALKCIQPEFHQELIDLAVKCVHTYKYDMCSIKETDKIFRDRMKKQENKT